jgi:addiction module HigA family antidote
MAATTNRMRPIHPGEILREEFLAPLKMSANALAAAISVPANRVSTIAIGKRAVTADTALRLARFFGTTPEFWLNLQQAHDLRVAEGTPALKRTLRGIRRVPSGSVEALPYLRASLGRSMKKARESAGLSQSELARKIRKSQPMVSSVEAGRISANERYVRLVLKACGLPADWGGNQGAIVAAPRASRRVSRARR